MASFKVICKAMGSWENVPFKTKVVVTKKLFGLIKSSSIVHDPQYSQGPKKEEICIVTEEYTNSNGNFYVLAGYPYGGYDTRFFIKMDEFTETQKEIAEKAECNQN